MQILVFKPTLVKFPKDVKRIVIVDKTQADFLKAIEGIFSGEVIGTEKILA